MERRYSQYPGGVVGLALLLLRIVVGSWLTQDGVYHRIATSSPGESTIQIIVGGLLPAFAVLLVCGLRTSVTVTVGAGLLVASALYSSFYDVYSQNWFCLLLQVFLCASVALLGPGGYSLDARLLGWRSIDISSKN
jgi:hypothetical protein